MSPSYRVPLSCLLLSTTLGCSGQVASEPAAPSAGNASGSEQPAATTAPATATATKAAPASTATARPPGAEPDRAAHMQQTFWLAIEARDAVIAGDLQSAKQSAHALAEHDYSGVFPASWKHWVGEMQKQAGEIELAPDLEGAAQAVGALALACGDCHYQQQAGPEKPRENPVPWEEPPDTVGSRMDRHYSGIEQLWLGLVDPSERAWRAGTITLTRAPLQAPQEQGKPVDPAVHAKVERVRELAKQARTAPTHQERARVYGELIATCAGCHENSPPPL